MHTRLGVRSIAFVSRSECRPYLARPTNFNLIFDNLFSNAFSLNSGTGEIRLAPLAIVYYICLLAVWVIRKHDTRLLSNIGITSLGFHKMIGRRLKMRLYL